MIKDAGDIIDRLAICQLKAIRINNPTCKREFREYLDELFVLFMQYPEIDWWGFIQEAVKVNDDIWKLESAVRQGKLDGDSQEVGKRAIEIRNFNKKRIDIKNRINTLTGEGYIEGKTDHLSE